MARRLALAAALVAVLLPVSGAGGADAQTPKRGGTVVVAFVVPEPACLNVVLIATCAPDNAQAGLLAAAAKVLMPPLRVSADYAWQPALATVDFTTRPPFTLTYRIHPKARWSDGVPVTARDFLFTLRALRKYDPESRRFHRAIRSIRAVDAKTVRVVLRPRDSNWRVFFGSILPSHVLKDQDLTKVWSEGIDNPKTGEPIGNGPFLVERWARGQELVLRRNPSYWGPRRAYVDRIVLRFGVNGNTLSDSFRRDAVDVAINFPPNFVAPLERQAGVEIVSRPGATWDHFAIRLGPGGHPVLRRSKLVRRALAYSIDRAALARQAFGDLDPKLEASQSAVYLDSSPFYRRNWSRYSFQPARARRLLEQAGCVVGTKGIYTCGGEPLSIRFSSPAVPGGLRPRVLDLVEPQLRAVGIELVREFWPGNVIFGQVLPAGRFEVAIMGWGNSGPSYLGKEVYGSGGEFNWTGYNQRLVTADLDQAQRILNGEQQARVVNRADRQLARDVPVIPLYQWVAWAAHGSDLRGFVVFPSVVDALSNAEDWWLDD